MKKLMIFLLAAVLTVHLIPAAAAAPHMSNFEKNQSYTKPFSDVWSGAWYAQDVKTCYEYGLMTGSGGGKFTPGGTLTVAQALAIACRIHDIYTNGKSTLKNGSSVWYQPYVDYAVENGIMEEGEFTDYTRPATRGETACFFAAALPPAELHAVNDIDHLTDVPRGPYYNAVLLLYNAGVLTGSGPDCRFRPDDTITRAEIAAITCRMVQPSARKHFVLLDGHDLGDAIPGLTVYMPGERVEQTEETLARFAALISDSGQYRCEVSAANYATLDPSKDVTQLSKKEAKYGLSAALGGVGFEMDISTVSVQDTAFGSVAAYRYEFRADDGEGQRYLCFGYVFVRDGALCTVTYLTMRDSTEFRAVIAAPMLDGQTVELT